MLARDYIFPWKPLRNEFEGQSRSNMDQEKNELTSQLGV